MSADNGIYILVTKGPEYRVIHTQSIDDIYWDAPIGDWNEGIIKDRFDNAEVFNTEKAAWEEADEMAKSYDILEYGISMIEDFEDKEYPL